MNPEGEGKEFVVTDFRAALSFSSTPNYCLLGFMSEKMLPLNEKQI